MNEPFSEILLGNKNHKVSPAKIFNEGPQNNKTGSLNKQE